MLTLNQLKHNLALTLQYMRASENLLCAAIVESRGDLGQYFMRHLEEEAQHAEWLREDLAGFELPTHPLPVAMAGSAYYGIRHLHPASLLGYMLVLEKPVPLEVVEQLENVYGASLLRTVRLHAEADVGHQADLIEIIAAQPDDVQKHISFMHELTEGYAKQMYQIISEVRG